MDEILYESTSILEALYDLESSRQVILEDIAIMNHNYKKTGDIDVLTEGASDIISLIITTFKKFIQGMKDWIIRNFQVLNSYHMEYGKMVEKYGKLIAQTEFEPFTIEGFKFTILSNPKPNVARVYKIIDDFNSHITKFSSITVEDVREIVKDECSEMAFSRLRADVLGYPNRISKEEFNRTVFMFYRNGQEFTENITVDKNAVDIILKNSGLLITEKKSASADKDAILSVLNRMEKFFSTKASDLYDDIQKKFKVRELDKSGETTSDVIDISDREMNKLVMYLTARDQQAIELTNIISLVFTERITALKSQTNQELEIMRRVLRMPRSVVTETTDIDVLESANSFPPTPNSNWAPVWEGISNMGGDGK